MKNGKTVELSTKQVTKLQKELEQFRVKKDFERKHNISVMTVYNVVSNKRCSQRIYQSLFKTNQSC
jgi:hypothetical protein